MKAKKTTHSKATPTPAPRASVPSSRAKATPAPAPEAPALTAQAEQAVKEVERAGAAAIESAQNTADAAMSAGMPGAVEAGLEKVASMGSELKADLEQFQKVWKNPVTQFGLTLSRDDEFLGSVTAIAKNPKLSELGSYEVILILLLWTVRAWRLAKVHSLFRQMLAQAFFAIAYWALALVAIPSFVWGEPFRTALSHLSRAVLRHFLS